MRNFVPVMLTLLFVFITFFICLFSYLFFAPFYIEINSGLNHYRLRLHQLASVRLSIENDLPVIETRLLGFTRKRPAFNQRATMDKKAKNNIKKRNAKSIPFYKILNVLRSFKINKCNISIDLGDMKINGILYPLFAWFSWYSRQKIEINFIGRNEISLEIKNSIARMSWAFISSNYKQKRL